MPKYNVMFARFPFGNQECPDSSDWMMRTLKKCWQDERLGEIHTYRRDDTPITMSRNHCIETAKTLKIDILVMIDSDMAPDLPYPGAKPFWESSLDWLLKHGPCVVAAPYCGPPPVENVYVFQWATGRTNNPNPNDMKIEQFSREDAAQRIGIERVAALPTGLIMIDMRVIEKISPPYFYYEWEKGGTESQKASTEDVTFTRDLALSEVPIYVNWDAWAGHWKRICVGKPTIIPVDRIRKRFVEAVLRGQHSNEQIMDVPPGGVDSPAGFNSGVLIRG